MSEGFLKKNELTANFHSAPLNLTDLKKSIKEVENCDSGSKNKKNTTIVECFLCDEKYGIKNDGNKEFLAHLLSAHRLVIADFAQIGNFQE